LNNVHFADLKQEVHNSWIVHRIDTTPKMIEQTLVMCNKYQQRGHKVNVPVKTEDPGVACIQQGVTEPLLGKGGKPLKCFHCGENHEITDCPC
jgi:hypothetical protein